MKCREVGPADPVAFRIIDAPLGTISIDGTAVQVRMLTRHCVEEFVEPPAINPVGIVSGRRE